MPPGNPFGLLVGAATGRGNPVDMLTSLIPGGAPAADMAKVAIQGAANALMPASPETEARFAQLMAGWTAVELRVNSLPANLPEAKDMLAAYRSWTKFRNDWLQGRKDGAQLPMQEGALQRVGNILNAAGGAPGMAPLGTPPGPPGPQLRIPSRPARPAAKREGPSKAILAVGAVALAGAAVGTALLLGRRP